MKFTDLIEATSPLIGKDVDASKDKETAKALKQDSIDPKNVKVKYTHKDDIRNGDTIIYKGNIRTVNTKDIKKDNMMGTSIFGDSFKLGREPVKVVIFKK